jgi:G:T-mismatch repair DNA endonuclease (very short patch repair protein)
MKKVIKFNTDGRYDIDMNETNIQFLADFSPKEKPTEQLLNNLFSSTIEFKAQDNSLDSIFIEYGMAIPGKDWKEEFRPHGILTTESVWYGITVKDGFVMAVWTEFLLELYKNQNIKRNIKDTSRQNDVGIGLIIFWNDFMRLYQDFQKNKRLKELGLRK